MNETAPAAAPPFDPAEFLRILGRRRWLLVLPWLTAVAIGTGAAFLLPPVYFSATLMLFDRGQNVQGPLGTMTGATDLAQQGEIMREQLQSSLFLRSVISSSGVRDTPATRKWALAGANKYPGLSPDEAVDAFLVDHLRDNVTIKVGRGEFYEIDVADFDPDRAHDFCAAIASQFVASSKARQLEAVQAQQEFSVEQLQIYRRQLIDAESRLEAARRSAISTTLSGTLINDKNIGFAQSLYEQAGVEVEDQRQKLQEIRGQYAGRVRENDPAQLVSPEVTSLASQITLLQGQLGRAMLADGATTGGASLRLALSRRTADLEAALEKVAARALPGLAADARELVVRGRLTQVDLAGREAWQTWLENEIAGYKRQLVMAPDRDLDIAHLQIEVDQARGIYTAFQQQSAAAQIAEAFQNAKISGRFLILEPATRPLTPGKPNRVLLVVLSVIVGGFIGVGSVLVTEHHDPSLRTADEVEQMLGLPVIGTLPRFDELERIRRRPRTGAAGGAALPAPRDQGLIQRLKVESPLGLEFKRIYLNLARTRGRALPRTLLITSSTRGEGKTTTAACLGITLAREHRTRTLLVDFDLRSSTLHRALGMPGSSWGLSQMLAQRAFDERFVRQTALENLDFLTAGRSERPAAEMVETEGVEWFLREAVQRYANVVIDSAPNLAVPDPLILGRAVEGVLYVVKAGATLRKAAEYGMRMQRQARDNVLGILLNDAGEFLPQYYGYRAQYYGYSTEAAEG